MSRKTSLRVALAVALPCLLTTPVLAADYEWASQDDGGVITFVEIPTNHGSPAQAAAPGSSYQWIGQDENGVFAFVELRSIGEQVLATRALSPAAKLQATSYDDSAVLTFEPMP